jgi:fatty-acyl-CoA synthase
VSHIQSSHWPSNTSRTLTLPSTNVFVNIEVSATRYPDKPCIVFYDNVLTYASFKAEVEALAGHLQKTCGVRRGDRVLLIMQNSPQWVLGVCAAERFSC